MPKLSQGCNGIPHAVTAREIGTLVGIGGLAISNSSGTFTNDQATLADVTNLSVIIKTSGRAVNVGLMQDPNTASVGYVGIDTTGNAPDLKGRVLILRNNVVISTYELRINVDSSAIHFYHIPSSAISCIDYTVPAGRHTYKVQIALDAGGTNGTTVANTVLYAYEQ